MENLQAYSYNLYKKKKAKERREAGVPHETPDFIQRWQARHTDKPWGIPWRL